MLKITKNQGSIQVTASESGFYPFDGTLTFPTNSLFTATSANTDMITFKSTSNGDVQFVGNYKDITISGRSYDTKQKFLTAFSNLANQGSVDAYTKAETDAKLNNKLTAQTNEKGALFISSSSNDDASSSVALYRSTVEGTNDVAIGWASTPSTEGMHNLAMLYNAQANGDQNIAIGDNRRCDGTKNVSIGCGKRDTVDVFGTGNVCIGASSQAHTASNNAVNNSIAIGTDARAGAYFCTVIGNSAHSKSSHTVAVGDNAYVDHDCDNSVAVGDSALAYGKNSVAIGHTSYADNDKPLNICCGKKANDEVLSVLQSDATGKLSILKGDGSDERMVIQDEIEALKNAGGGGSVDAYTKTETDNLLNAKQNTLTAGTGITIDENNVISSTGGTGGSANPYVNVKGTGSATIPDTVTDAVAIGSSASVTNDSCIAIGKDTLSQAPTGHSSIAIGSGAKVTKDNADGIAIGSGAKVNDGSDSIVIGNNAYSESSSYTVAIGRGAFSKQYYSIAIGYGAGTSANDSVSNRESIAIGSLARANGSASIAIGLNSRGERFGVAIGSGARVSGQYGIAIGYDATASTDTPMVINAGDKTMIQGDANGKISVLLGDGTDTRMVISDEITALKAEITTLKAEIAALKGGA